MLLSDGPEDADGSKLRVIGYSIIPVHMNWTSSLVMTLSTATPDPVYFYRIE